MFNHTNQPLISSFYIKRCTYLLPNKRGVSTDPQFSAQGAREGVNRGTSPNWHIFQKFFVPYRIRDPQLPVHPISKGGKFGPISVNR